MEDYREQHQRNKAENSVSRAMEAYLRSDPESSHKKELAAIAYGKLLAFYSLDLIDEDDFHKYRHFLGY